MNWMKKKMGTMVSTLDQGNSTRYAPITPAMAPEAPIMGAVLSVATESCSMAAPTPEAR